MREVGLGIANQRGGLDPLAIASRKKRHFIAVDELRKGGNLVAVTVVVLGRDLAFTSFVGLGVEVEQYRPTGQASCFSD